MVQAIGIDIGGSKLRIYMGPEKDGHSATFSTGKAVGPEQLEQVIQNFLNKLSNKPDSIGIAVPGLVKDQCVIVSDVLPRLTGWKPIHTSFANYRITLLNDVDAAAQEVIAMSRRTGSMAVVIVGTGVGGALIVDGSVLRGAQGSAGEIGWMPVIVDGKAMRLDDVAGGAALLDQLGGDVTHADAQLAAGDRAACKIVDGAGRALGYGLAGLINLFNPERVVLAGGTLRYRGYLGAAMRAAESSALPQAWESCEFEVPADGHTLPARGAARAAAQELLQDAHHAPRGPETP